MGDAGKGPFKAGEGGSWGMGWRVGIEADINIVGLVRCEHESRGRLNWLAGWLWGLLDG